MLRLGTNKTVHTRFKKKNNRSHLGPGTSGIALSFCQTCSNLFISLHIFWKYKPSILLVSHFLTIKLYRSLPGPLCQTLPSSSSLRREVWIPAVSGLYWKLLLGAGWSDSILLVAQEFHGFRQLWSSAPTPPDTLHRIALNIMILKEATSPKRNISSLHWRKYQGFPIMCQDLLLLHCRWKKWYFKEESGLRDVMSPMTYRLFTNLNQAIQTSVLHESRMSFHPLAAWQQAMQKSGSSLGLLTGTSALLSVWLLTDQLKDKWFSQFCCQQLQYPLPSLSVFLDMPLPVGTAY